MSVYKTILYTKECVNPIRRYLISIKKKKKKRFSSDACIYKKKKVHRDESAQCSYAIVRRDMRFNAAQKFQKTLTMPYIQTNQFKQNDS